ncbi:triose-phosphate isomerase [Helicobacter bizzozeronii]|uniref:triose-phosphate isomerase n=1 Tax=Helicobacter bizzozeronii TaxID=56877 RepID=UPI003F695F49
MLKYVLANFKSYAIDLLPYLECLDSALDAKLAPYVTLFPPILELGQVQHAYTHFSLGAQNAYPALDGAFTGEVTLQALQKRHIKSVLIGHSERRLLESDSFCAEKFHFFKSHHFQIIFCIGESLQLREQGEKALVAHLLNQLEGIDLDYPKLIVAYEPIWAIGTGVSAQSSDIASTLCALKAGLRQAGRTIPLMVYGGSVQTSNATEILDLAEVDGVLVGKACLDLDSLLEIIKISAGKELV